jgi:DNA-binding response OmpR family regulator
MRGRPGLDISVKKPLVPVGAEMEIRTVDVNIGRLRQALNRNGQSNLIRTVRAAGYSLDATEA